MEERHLLVLSPFAYSKPSRPTRASSSERNRFVLGFARGHYLPHVEPGSGLEGDIKASPAHGRG
jgi:hypothetical protein